MPLIDAAVLSAISLASGVFPFANLADVPPPAWLGFALVLTGSVLCAISRHLRSRV